MDNILMKIELED